MSHEYQAFKLMQADLSISPFLWVVSKLTHLNGVNRYYVYLVLWYFTPQLCYKVNYAFKAIQILLLTGESNKLISIQMPADRGSDCSEQSNLLHLRSPDDSDG